MAAHQVFPRRWVGRRLPCTTTRDSFRSIIDNVFTRPEMLHSDDVETGNSAMIIQPRPNAKDTIRGHRTGQSAEKTFLNGHARPNAEKTIATNHTGPSAEIPVRDSNPVERAFRFRVVSYNVLTDNCIRDGQYLYCPAEIRCMDSRHGRIMNEIRTIDPDVICLQEADKDHFRKRLKPEMEELGYAGVNQATSDGQGLATFWRSSMFEMVKQKSILLSDAITDYIEARHQ